MSARRSIADLMRSSEEWRQFFRSCCYCDHFQLRAQAWQWTDELVDRGYAFKEADVEDALAILAADLLPDSPAARWDSEWASELMHDALAYLAEFYDEDTDLTGLDSGPITDAAYAGDRLGYRAAIREYVRAGRRAFQAAKESAA